MDHVVDRAHKEGFFLLLLGACVFLFMGIGLVLTDPHCMTDFRTAYFSTKSVLIGIDPYDPQNVLDTYRHTGAPPFKTGIEQFVATHNVYPPTEFMPVAPVALLPFRIAKPLWFLLIAGGFICACFLVLDIVTPSASRLVGFLLGILIAGSSSLLFYANPAGIAITLTILAVWCFMRQRWLPVGVFALALGLALKPHDAGLIWLCFLLAGNPYRKLAWQSLGLAALLSLPAFLWISHIAPNWPAGVAANLKIYAQPGSINDPASAYGTCFITSLQVIFCFIRNDPHFYNLASIVAMAPLLLVWAVATFRIRGSITSLWFALAAIAPLSMLPVYHRQYDAKLIILTLPALALLWTQRATLRHLALALTGLAFLLSSDLFWAAILLAFKPLPIVSLAAPARMRFASVTFPVPLSLLALGVFYLWVLFRFHPEPEPSSNQGSTPSETETCALPAGKLIRG